MRVAIADVDKEGLAANVVRKQPVEWIERHEPAANTIATVTKAGETGKRHYITQIIATTTASAADLKLQMKFGATVVWAMRLAAGTTSNISFNHPLQAGVGESVTLEYTVAPGASQYQIVQLFG